MQHTGQSSTYYEHSFCLLFMQAAIELQCKSFKKRAVPHNLTPKKAWTFWYDTRKAMWHLDSKKSRNEGRPLHNSI